MTDLRCSILFALALAGCQPDTATQCQSLNHSNGGFGIEIDDPHQ